MSLICIWESAPPPPHPHFANFGKERDGGLVGKYPQVLQNFQSHQPDVKNDITFINRKDVNICMVLRDYFYVSSSVGWTFLSNHASLDKLWKLIAVVIVSVQLL